MSDMGGVKHFNIAVDTPKGDVDLLKKVLEGANTEVDEAAEERKGGASKIGKCFYSAGDEWVCHRWPALCASANCGPSAPLLADTPCAAGRTLGAPPLPQHNACAPERRRMCTSLAFELLACPCIA